MDTRDGVALLPLADDDAIRLLDAARVPESRRGECWWLILEDGTAIAGDRGGSVELLARLGATRPLGRALRALRLSAALDAVDRVLARARGRLGAVVPEGPAPRRFP